LIKKGKKATAGFRNSFLEKLAVRPAGETRKPTEKKKKNKKSLSIKTEGSPQKCSLSENEAPTGEV